VRLSQLWEQRLWACCSTSFIGIKAGRGGKEAKAQRAPLSCGARSKTYKILKYV